jgi:cyclic-di-AMP phosphodiesterase PgpH
VKSVFTRSNFLKEKTGLLKPHSKNIRGIFPRLALAFFVIVAISSMYISLTVKSAGLIEYTVPALKAGDISPNREIALIDFEIPKPSEQLEEEQKQAAAGVIPVFSIDYEALRSIQTEIDTLFSVMNSFSESAVTDSAKKSIEDAVYGEMTFSEIASFKRRILFGKSSVTDSVYISLKRAFNQLYTQLIVSSKDDLRHISEEFIMLEDYEDKRTVRIEDVLDTGDVTETLKQKLREYLGKIFLKRSLDTIQDFTIKFIRPNLYYNAPRTNELREQAMSAIPHNLASYKRNERIIEANVSVNALQLAALAAYKKELESRTFEENRRKHYAIAFGKIIIGLGIIMIIIRYIYIFRLKLYRSFSQLLLLCLISAIPLLVAYYISWSGNISEFMIPVALATILATILFDAGIGILISLGIALIVASFNFSTGARLGIIYFIAGSVGVLTVGQVRHRKEFYRSMLFVPLSMAIAVLATNDWISNSSFAVLGKDIFIAAANGFFCPIIAIGFLPLLESFFKIATDITLLELSDLNNPLLKDVAVKAPGTFSSVLMVGSLAEAAAEKIGANPLLARVGSYYHDIGKTLIPEYFIENQYGGDNPHDRLSPHMSALVIASHVKEGYELGLKYGLPEAILDIIKQHHGTSLMASVYHKAVENSGGESVDESAFRYPGPKPQTREAGIVMLADLVEAASRSVNEKAPGKFKSLISTIIQKRFLEGELDECDLTLKNLHNVEESFLPVLVGSFHSRVEYPWQKEENAKNGIGNGAAKPDKKNTVDSGIEKDNK